MTIVFVGIDLAKNIFAVHGINEAGKAELGRPAVERRTRSSPPNVVKCEIQRTTSGCAWVDRDVSCRFHDSSLGATHVAS